MMGENQNQVMITVVPQKLQSYVPTVLHPLNEAAKIF